ncbi:MAG: hypothetical protein R3A48_23795 [Polyangiales bacterium]
MRVVRRGAKTKAAAGRCRDTQSDRAHCGACGNACAAGQVCSGGRCVVSCPAGQTDCAGSCRDTQTDRSHCGACGPRLRQRAGVLQQLRALVRHGAHELLQAPASTRRAQTATAACAGRPAPAARSAPRGAA